MLRSLLSCVKNNLESNLTYVRNVHICSVLLKDDRKWTYKSLPTLDEGTDGERVLDLDFMIEKKHSIFPDSSPRPKIFDGIPFDKIPICNIKVSPNNTIINVTNDKGVPLLIRSCGIEGFKHTRKGTNIAAQATAISISAKAMNMGFKNMRVRVQGLGPGRMAAIKGLQMGGLNIISVTDATRVSWNPPRPRKAKRL